MWTRFNNEQLSGQLDSGTTNIQIREYPNMQTCLHVISRQNCHDQVFVINYALFQMDEKVL